VALIVVVGIAIGIWLIAKNSNGEKVLGNNSEQSETTTTDTSKSYFDDNANVMYFYSDECRWCIEESKVFEEIAPLGYKVKPMNIGTDRSLASKYNIEGTPTFVAKNGERNAGFMEKDALIKWLDAHK